MANAVNDFSQLLAQLGPTFPPQVLSATGNGNAIDVRKVGTNLISAQLLLGDATALTSLAVKMQASPDGTTGWVDIDGATFTTVTADPGVTSVVPETISFQLPPAPSATAAPYQYVRAVATLVGTSINMAVNLLATRKYDEAANYQNAPGNGGNNVVN